MHLLGYVGYDEGGVLTEAVRRNPYSIVLFDEIEKAHKDVFNILLQILDDGRLSDSQGRTVDFKNTIIIMTSNLGSDYILENENSADEKVIEILRGSFRPEFINRIDEIIVFHSLKKEIVGEILDKILFEINTRLQSNLVHMEITEKAKEKIIEESFEPEFGARPIKRYVTKNIESLLAHEIIKSDLSVGDTLEIDVENDNFVIRKK